MSGARNARRRRRLGWWHHVVQASGLDRRELRRPVDRTRSRLKLALPLLLALAAACSVFAAVANFHHGQAEARAQAAHLHRMDAVVASLPAQQVRRHMTHPAAGARTPRGWPRPARQ
ncbi:hypothetical protein GCM10010193_25750 [Kitasatospora atroaurantiaca]|uniref:Uncharacterized protein n=1 Tax=Kitasatospora atroaurantiaca TaxID=285545 RepID=A0A561F0G9_9ACTN|nr:hypothetical protein [Kitasatospora atroaurantiaca]TWE21360.1 hypothetical protein FB465_6540 [Kitasatospora atroaurantiaca]